MNSQSACPHAAPHRFCPTCKETPCPIGLGKTPAVVRYDVIRGALQTGDAVLFSGKGRISEVIKKLSGSPWSHIGMVQVMPEYDFVCLWESTTLSNITDLDSGKPCSGVQLVPLRTRIEQYDGAVAIRQLQDVQLAPEDLANLIAMRKRFAHTPYEASELQLLRSVYDGPGGANAEDLSTLFCSEVFAEAYQAMRLIDSRRPSNEYTPADFSAAKENLPWLRGRFGPEVQIRV